MSIEYKNKDRRAAMQKAWVRDNAEKVKGYKKAWKERNADSAKEYYRANKELIKEKSRKRYEANKNKAKEYGERYKSRKRELRSIRRKTDPLYRVKNSLASSVRQAFKRVNYRKTEKTAHLLGADFSIVKEHIENKFTAGMSWTNYGEWHIDHITPLASAKNELEVRRLCHYKNLQPLWALDNIKKGSKIINQQLMIAV